MFLTCQLDKNRQEHISEFRPNGNEFTSDLNQISAQNIGQWENIHAQIIYNNFISESNIIILNEFTS